MLTFFNNSPPYETQKNFEKHIGYNKKLSKGYSIPKAYTSIPHFHAHISRSHVQRPRLSLGIRIGI